MAHRTGERMTPEFPSAVRLLLGPDDRVPMKASKENTSNCSYCLRLYRNDVEDHRSCGCLLCGGFGTVFDGQDETACQCMRLPN